MTTSGIYDFTLSNASITVEAFERCGRLPATLQRHDWVSARSSLNLVLADWANRGVNLWKVQGPTQVSLVQGQPTYLVDQTSVSILDMYYSQLGAGGNGCNIDRIMLPISRTEYAEYPNKLQQGTPTVYWYDKLSPIPQFSLYQCPQFSLSDGYCLYYYWLSRIEDASSTSGQTPDIPYLGLEALCADLAVWIAKKPTLAPNLSPQRRAELKADAGLAWERFASTNREDVPIAIRPQTYKYWAR